MSGIVMGAVHSVSRISEDYPILGDEFRAYLPGSTVQRGRGRECIDYTLEIYEPEYCIVGSPALDTNLVHLDILQTLAGSYDKELIESVSTGGFTRSYGPRTADQLALAVTELIEYPYSAHALVYVGTHDDIWNTRAVAPTGRNTVETPGVSLWQFIRRGGKLHMLTHHSSLDIVREMPYEIPIASAVQMAVAKAAGCDTGILRVRCGTAYMHDRDADITLWGLKDGGGRLEIPWLRDNIDTTAMVAESKIRKERKLRGLNDRKVEV